MSANSAWVAKLKTYRAACRARAEAWEKAETLRLKLVAICPHPDDEVRDYTWHHGYGKYVTGDHCDICRAQRSFKGSGEWVPYDVWSARVRDDDD